MKNYAVWMYTLVNYNLVNYYNSFKKNINSNKERAKYNNYTHKYILHKLKVQDY
jgi:hypothetical protein